MSIVNVADVESRALTIVRSAPFEVCAGVTAIHVSLSVVVCPHLNL